MKYDPDAWVFTQSRLSELDSVLITPAVEPPKLLVVLCHGYGAPGTDLLTIFDEVLHYLPDSSPQNAYLFPEAPFDLEEYGMPGGRAWWPLNMAKLMNLAMTNNFGEMRETEPPEMDAARSKLQSTIEAALATITKQYSLPSPTRIVLGGFSQGAMLAIDTLMRGSLDRVAGVLAYSGALICESKWRHTQKAVRGIPYIQSHGTMDQILPFQTGTWLNSLFNDLGLQGSLLSFDGPHTIPPQAIMQSAKLIHALSLVAT